MLVITLSSCSKKQIIKTELKTIYKIKYKELDKKLTADCDKIHIKDKLTNEETDELLMESMINGDTCSERMQKIRKLTTNAKQ